MDTNMSRYVDIDNNEQLIDSILLLLKDCKLKHKSGCLAGSCKECIRRFFIYTHILPTANVTPVVRCKDCGYAKKSKVVLGIPDYKCLKTNTTCLDADDFCSYGERKDENDR